MTFQAGLQCGALGGRNNHFLLATEGEEGEEGDGEEKLSFHDFFRGDLVGSTKSDSDFLIRRCKDTYYTLLVKPWMCNFLEFLMESEQQKPRFWPKFDV